ncbi:tRNA (N(6)-L-threonylcarbamoyladenosine(37)-C(2))-methylthiotransferase MtaB [Spirochaetota bacterium]
MQQASLVAAFKTLGCKLNQAETDAIADSFKSSGAVIKGWNQAADVYVLNTCTVTGKAEQKARRELRLAQRQNPKALLLVTGCYAELDPDALAALVPGALLVPGSKKSAMLKIAQGLAEAKLDGLDLQEEGRLLLQSALGLKSDPFAFFQDSRGFHSRPQLKIQDGCDRRCTYCRVCLARGPSISLEPEEVLRRAILLEEKGIAELVLTGINLAQYRAGGMDFSALLMFLLKNTGKIAFRLSSWEPEKLDGPFLEAFSQPRIRPHLHLAIQSGSNSILKAMGRPYSRDTVLKAAEAARRYRHEPFIAADMITGFPGETDADFADSLELVRQIRPAWLHVFTFSPRPGTKAFDMKPVPERIAAERAKILGQIAEQGLKDFAAGRLGSITEAVLEKRIKDGASGIAASATSEEYLKLLVKGLPQGKMASCRCRIIELPDSTAADKGFGQSRFDALAEYIP